MSQSPAFSSPFNRDAQFAAKRRAVILSAAGAFRRRGYHNTSMIDIAKSLELTKPALYYYVKNKEEILFESHLMAYDSMDDILSQKRADPENALEKLDVIFRDFVELLTQSGVSLLTDVNSLKGELRDQVLARRAKIERAIVKIVKSGQADGSIRSADPRLLVFFFMGALNWLNAWYDGEGRLKGSDIADHFSAQLKQGIAA